MKIVKIIMLPFIFIIGLVFHLLIFIVTFLIWLVLLPLLPFDFCIDFLSGDYYTEKSKDENIRITPNDDNMNEK